MTTIGPAVVRLIVCTLGLQAALGCGIGDSKPAQPETSDDSREAETRTSENAPTSGNTSLGSSTAAGVTSESTNVGNTGGPVATSPSAPTSSTQTQVPVEAGVPRVLPNVNGTWAMFDFEDPVVVTLVQNGETLTGRGCCAPGGEAFCCGDIVGGLADDGQVVFGFPVLGAQTYRAAVSVSAAGDRMTGAFYPLTGSGFLAAWARVPDNENWLEHEDAELRDAVAARQGHFALSLTQGDGDDFAFDAEIQLRLRVNVMPLISGDLGAFWAGEMVWHAASSTLVVGPVPETQPDLPIELELHFNEHWLQSADAEMPSGERYSFVADTSLTALRKR
jgi:hypothetical protein